MKISKSRLKQIIKEEIVEETHCQARQTCSAG